MTTAPALGCAVGRELGAVSQSAHGRPTALTSSAPGVPIARTVRDAAVNDARLASRRDTQLYGHDRDVEYTIGCALGTGSRWPVHRCVPRVAPARGPHELSFDLDQGMHYDSSAPEPVPEFEFDQRVSW